jgi:energy-coupling factor transporter ATP-binding protein EcfA2
MDIWAMADAGHGLGNEATDTNKGAANSNNANMLDLGEESSTVLVVGDSGCGKSTLIQSFLKPNVSKEPKPTFALEYAFARRKNAGKENTKTLAHLWELGGDIYEPKLLSVPLNVPNLSNASVIIVLDLSKPEDCFLSMKRWLTVVREHLNARYNELKNSGSQGNSLAHGMKDRAIGAYNSVTTANENAAADDHSPTPAPHVDISRLRVSEVPILIIANKNDLFRNKHSAADRRTLLQVRVRVMSGCGCMNMPYIT